MSYYDDWSIQARVRHQAASAERTLRQIWFEKGPYLEKDGGVIVVPSPRFRPEISKFWKSKGFQFRRDDGGYTEWWRPTSRKYKGVYYSPTGWLAAAQAHYQRFFPDWKRPQQEQ